MAISVVQRAVATPATTTLTKAFASNITAGNAVLVIGIAVNPSFAMVISSDTQSMFSGAAGTAVATMVDAGNSIAVGIWLATNSVGGAESVTLSDTSVKMSMFLYEVAGLATTGAFDSVSTEATTGSPPLTANSITTVQNNELLMGLFINTGSATPTWSAGSNGFGNIQTSVTAFSYAASEELIVSSTGNYAADINWSGGNALTIMGWTFGFADTTVVPPVPIPPVGIKAQIGHLRPHIFSPGITR